MGCGLWHVRERWATEKWEGGGYELVAGPLGHPGVARGTNAQQLHGLGVLDSKAQQLVGGGK